MQHKIHSTIIAVALSTLIALFGQCTKEIPPVETIEIASIGNDTLFVGKQYQLEVILSPAKVTHPRLSWSISDAQLASIQYGGVLKLVKSGTVTVYVNSLQSGGKKVRASRKFTILSSGVYLKDKSVVINPLEKKKLEYHFLPIDYKPSEKLTWISTDESIVSVDQEGNLRGMQAGSTVVRLRLGNPLAGFFSEDSCLVTVQNFIEPKYTYQDGVLELEQEVPGLLPMIAKDMPHFKKIIIKGPINGSDLIFFIENNKKIDLLDLANTRVVKGGRTMKTTEKAYSPSGDYVDVQKILMTNDNHVPEGFFRQMNIKHLIVPPFLTSAFDFGGEFVIEYLKFPDSYKNIEIHQCNLNTVILPKNLESFHCNTSIVKERKEEFFKKYIAIFNTPVVLPASLKTFHAIAQFKENLTIPSEVRDLSIAGSFKTLQFAANKNLSSFARVVPRYIFFDQHVPIEVEKLILPEGLTRIERATFENTSAYLLKSHTLKSIIFPSTLQTIEFSAFSEVIIESSILFPEGLKEIEHSAFYSSTIPEVHLPSTIEKIGSEAFAMCPRLENVYIKRATPPRIGTLVFLRTSKMGKMHRLHVPKGAKQAYQDAGFLDYFFEIVEITNH